MDVLVVRVDRLPRRAETRTAIRLLDFPDNPALPLHGQRWRDTTTVYGPAFTIASEPLAVVAGDSDAVAAWTYKVLAAAAALGAALLAGRLARRKAFAIALVGWNPILAVHLAGGGHNDAWVGALILAALGARGIPPAAERRCSLGARDRRQVGAVCSSLCVRSRRVRAGGASAPRVRPLQLASLPPRRLYGLAWPLAIFPLAGNAALETSYAIPHGWSGSGCRDSRRPRCRGGGSPAVWSWLVREAAAAVPASRLAACSCW